MFSTSILGLGCLFLTRQCTDRTVYPYLCDPSENQPICTPDHLSKVYNMLTVCMQNICTVCMQLIQLYFYKL